MENRPPNVFVSSTMYDLSYLRERLRQFIEGYGWTAVMAEHDSFSVDATETTVENSLRNVRENTDIFVLIVGARYGSVDPGSDRSITNLEFSVARQCGLPVYVFVDSNVLAQLSVWRNNPDADYSGVVDTPRVFEFIDSFYGSGEVWTSSFASSDDILNTLRQQLAYLVRDSLRLRQQARDQDRLLEELKGKALMVALRRDEYWEYRLFGTVLKAELERRTPLRREIEHGLAGADVTYVDLLGFGEWAQDRFSELGRLGETAEAIVNYYLPQAFGGEGVSGDPLEIVGAARRLAKVWEDCARWTLRCRAVRVDSRAERVIDLLSKGNASTLNEIWDYGHRFIPTLDEGIKEHAAGRSSTVDLRLTLTVDFEAFNEELARLGETF